MNFIKIGNTLINLDNVTDVKKTSHQVQFDFNTANHTTDDGVDGYVFDFRDTPQALAAYDFLCKGAHKFDAATPQPAPEAGKEAWAYDDEQAGETDSDDSRAWEYWRIAALYESPLEPPVRYRVIKGKQHIDLEQEDQAIKLQDILREYDNQPSDLETASLRSRVQELEAKRDALKERVETLEFVLKDARAMVDATDDLGRWMPNTAQGQLIAGRWFDLKQTVKDTD